MTSESGGATRPQADAVAMMRYDANKKTALVGYLLWFFLGLLGAIASISAVPARQLRYCC
jgi:hypothetical protein